MSHHQHHNKHHEHKDTHQNNGIQTSHPSEEVIRSAAYRKWEEAGCPVCDGVDFWLQAERECVSEPANKTTTGKH